MAAAGNELEGAPLRYLIGAEGPWDGRDGELIMAPYGTAVAPRRGYSAKYVNLYREDGEPLRSLSSAHCHGTRVR
jgi:hypothetical protein